MSTKFIFVTGGVVSSLGKGITASTLGLLLKERGFKVFMQKFDPYLNIDPGTMSPFQHGEVFVTNDGAETDLDLGHYERFIDENLSKESSVSAGKIYKSVLDKERKGQFLGATIQVVPHITNEIKSRIELAAIKSKADIVITEIGGTVGDIESTPFLEAIRQFRLDKGYDNVAFIHATLVPYLRTSDEHKTKPTQHSVKELLSVGIQPDAIVLRTETNLGESEKDKISLFCNVAKEAVFEAVNEEILYNIIKSMHDQKFDDYILNRLHLEPKKDADISKWLELVETIRNLNEKVNIGLVGKYIELHDAYLSVAEALKHAGYFYSKKIHIRWIDSTELCKDNLDEKMKNLHGIIVPGGFGSRGTEGKELAIEYARVNDLPFLGICFGMQLAIVEYARNVLKMEDPNSTEIDEKCVSNVIDYLPNQYEGINLGGTMRLGAYKCELIEGSIAKKLYNCGIIEERHRHRYEFNNKFEDAFTKDGNVLFSGINPETHLKEIFELKNKKFFIACQFHPEFKSRPIKPHPLFKGLISAAIEVKNEQECENKNQRESWRAK